MDILKDCRARLIAGCVTTGAVLAALHWLPWWFPLRRLVAYILGSLAILLGQGIYLKFNRTWQKLCAIVAAGGLVVIGAYWYDGRANERVRRLTGNRADGE